MNLAHFLHIKDIESRNEVTLEGFGNKEKCHNRS